MKFIHEPDAADEPTIWVLENGDTDDYRYTALFRRVDLAPDDRRFWPDVVARMTGTSIKDDAATVHTIARALWDGTSEHLPMVSAYKVLAALTGVPHD